MSPAGLEPATSRSYLRALSPTELRRTSHTVPNTDVLCTQPTVLVLVPYATNSHTCVSADCTSSPLQIVSWCSIVRAAGFEPAHPSWAPAPQAGASTKFRHARLRHCDVPPAGFEPATPRSEVWCSIQLSYEGQRHHNICDGAGGRIRTCDPHLRKVMLYSTELRRLTWFVTRTNTRTSAQADAGQAATVMHAHEHAHRT